MKYIIIPVIVTTFTMCVLFNLFINKRSVKVGDQYKWSYDYDRIDNPFKEIRIDTITIMDIRNDYVLFKYNQGYTQSCTLRFMNRTGCAIEKI